MPVDVTAAVGCPGAAHLAASSDEIIQLAERTIIGPARELRQDLDGVIPVLANAGLGAGGAEHVGHGIGEPAVFLPQAVAHGAIPVAGGHDHLGVLLASVGLVGDCRHLLDQLIGHVVDVRRIPVRCLCGHVALGPMELIRALLDLQHRKAIVVEQHLLVATALEPSDLEWLPSLRLWIGLLLLKERLLGLLEINLALLGERTDRFSFVFLEPYRLHRLYSGFALKVGELQILIAARDGLLRLSLRHCGGLEVLRDGRSLFYLRGVSCQLRNVIGGAGDIACLGGLHHRGDTSEDLRARGQRPRPGGDVGDHVSGVAGGGAEGALGGL